MSPNKINKISKNMIDPTFKEEIIEETSNQIGVLSGSVDAHKAVIATPTTLGHVKVGTNLTIMPDGTLNASGGDLIPHTSTIASTTILGHVKVDGTSITIDENGVISGYSIPKDDSTNAPGSKYLLGGNMQAGYFGRVPASELFTATALSTAVGISAGTIQHDSTDWLKFAWKGKIIFRAMKAIRHSIQWDQINAAGCVMGTKTVTKNGNTYKVRLMQGALTNPSLYDAPDRGAKGSEWNGLMLPIHEKAKTKAWYIPAYVEDNLPDWGIGFTDADLLMHSTHGSGSYQWCQEVRNTNTTDRVLRGLHGVSNSGSNTSSNANSLHGWSPVLELI